MVALEWPEEMFQATPSVDGRTGLVPLLAFPSTHVRTPAFFNEHCVVKQRNAVMLPWQVAPRDLHVAFQAIRLIDSIKGVVVTIPHKTTVASFCDELEGVAKLTGVCNVIRKTADGRLIGALLDGKGFVEGLRAKGHSITSRSALLVGAGGAATAVAFAMAEAGLRHLGLINRSVDKARVLAKQLAAHYPNLSVEFDPAQWGAFDFAINGTALGMHAGDALPLDVNMLGTHCCVAEVVMNPDMTPLLCEAEQRGLPVHRGVHMIEAQVPLLVDITTSELHSVSA
jgi:shikimate dehydrogenase